MRQFTKLQKRLFIVVIALLAITIVWISRQQGAPTEPEPAAQLSYEQTSQGAIQALIIDQDGNGVITLATLQQGEDVLLAIKPDAKALQATSPSQQAKAYLFNALNSVLNHDVNRDGVIGPQDPIYAELMVLSFRSAHPAPHLMPLARAGVRMLVFKPRYLLALQQGHELPLNVVVGYAIMTDSSRRQLKQMIVPLSLFKQPPTEDKSNNQT